MTYKMFLDDERFPVGDDWVIARTFDDAVATMIARGCPEYISFDHDLGKDVPTGKAVADWMVNRDMDNGETFIPSNFAFYVHSQNPVGARNIQNLLDQYLEFQHS